MPYPGLAIDFGGSVEQRFRRADFGVAYLDEPLTSNAPLERREKIPRFSFLRFVRSNG
jgi:hypothetical protein